MAEPANGREADRNRTPVSLVRAWRQEVLATQPVDAESRPARRQFLVLTDAEIMIARRIDVKLGLDTGAFQGHIHESTILRVGPAVTLLVVRGMSQENRGRVGRDLDAGRDLILPFGLQIAR